MEDADAPAVERAAPHRAAPWLTLVVLAGLCVATALVSAGGTTSPPFGGSAQMTPSGELLPLGVTGFAAPRARPLWLGLGIPAVDTGPLAFAVTRIHLIAFPHVPTPPIVHWEMGLMSHEGGLENPSGPGWPPRRVPGVPGVMHRISPDAGYYAWPVLSVRRHVTYRGLTLVLGVRWPRGASEFGFQGVTVDFRGRDLTTHAETFGEGYLVCAADPRGTSAKSRTRCVQSLSAIFNGA